MPACDLEKRGMSEEAGILRSHMEMIKDPSVTSKIKEERSITDSVPKRQSTRPMKFFADLFEATGDELTMQRAADIRDINSSLCSKLTNNDLMDPAQLPKGAILVIRESTPSMAVKIDPAKTQGIIAETGGYTSHAAILARALGIPAVLGVAGALTYIENGKTLILDGISGIVLQEPDNDTKRVQQESRDVPAAKRTVKCF